MWRKVAKVGAVKTERNRSRSGRKVGVSWTCGLLVERGPGCCATLRIPPRRKEVAIPDAYPTPGKVRNLNLGAIQEQVPRSCYAGIDLDEASRRVGPCPSRKSTSASAPS